MNATNAVIHTWFDISVQKKYVPLWIMYIAALVTFIIWLTVQYLSVPSPVWDVPTFNKAQQTLYSTYLKNTTPDVYTNQTGNVLYVFPDGTSTNQKPEVVKDGNGYVVPEAKVKNYILESGVIQPPKWVFGVDHMSYRGYHSFIVFIGVMVMTGLIAIMIPSLILTEQWKSIFLIVIAILMFVGVFIFQIPISLALILLFAYGVHLFTVYQLVDKTVTFS